MCDIAGRLVFSRFSSLLGSRVLPEEGGRFLVQPGGGAAADLSSDLDCVPDLGLPRSGLTGPGHVKPESGEAVPGHGGSDCNQLDGLRIHCYLLGQPTIRSARYGTRLNMKTATLKYAMPA